MEALGFWQRKKEENEGNQSLQRGAPEEEDIVVGHWASEKKTSKRKNRSH